MKKSMTVDITKIWMWKFGLRHVPRFAQVMCWSTMGVAPHARWRILRVIRLPMIVSSRHAVQNTANLGPMRQQLTLTLQVSTTISKDTMGVEASARVTIMRRRF